MNILKPKVTVYLLLKPKKDVRSFLSDTTELINYLILRIAHTAQYQNIFSSLLLPLPLYISLFPTSHTDCPVHRVTILGYLGLKVYCHGFCAWFRQLMLELMQYKFVS